MLTEVVTATNALEGFAAYLSTFWTEASFQDAVGAWNIPPLSRADLVTRARDLAERLKTVPDEKVSGELKRKIDNLPQQIAWFQANTLPQLSGGNLPQVVTNFDLIMSNVEHSLPNIATLDWERVDQAHLLPRDLARRIRNIEAALKALAPRAADLEEKVQRINDAHAAASDLPTDILALKEARDEVVTLSDEAVAAVNAAKASQEQCVANANKIVDQAAVARQLISNIEQAYSAATTVGLAASFTERAKQLGRSTWIWVALLVLALGAGGVLGHVRLNAIQVMIKDPNVSPRWIWLDAAMSILSVAAPVWFAWLSTRQISQRFRLAEDYGFKASVARAYEGYRKEAARIDPEFEARLFASALDRLDEAPLRFLSTEEHSSPYEALLESAGFQNALEKIPSLRETVRDVLDRTLGSPRRAAPEIAKEPVAALVEAAAP